MKSIFRIILVVSCVTITVCEHLFIGNVEGKHLIYHSVEQYRSFPLMTRIKEIFYSSPDERYINSIIAYDNTQSQATALVTAGGVGHTYVNIRMKSERGKGLDYDIGIYA